jgi:hypothetical protein
MAAMLVAEMGHQMVAQLDESLVVLLKNDIKAIKIEIMLHDI